MTSLFEATLRTDITRRATGFAFKRYLGKHVDQVKKHFDSDAKRKLKQHSTMDDGRHVYHGVDNAGHHHYMVVDHHGHVQASVNAEKKGKSHMIEMAVAKPGANVHKLYHHLITKHGHILTSKEQSPGGLAIWQKLRKMGGVNVHGYHPKTGRGEHIDIVHDTSQSHVSRDDLKTERQGRGGGTRAQRKKEYADLKKTQAMVLVAHKDKNIKPSRSVRESTSSTVLRVIKESINGTI
jgi:hypothetical protein